MKGFVSEEKILKRWEEKLKNIKSDESFNIYIENPFCVNQCLYCKHKGSLLKNHTSQAKIYYEDFLPNQIRRFSYLLKEKTPDTIYFGGGTSSIMSEKIMENIFNEIPNFKKIPNKVFECNPSLLNNTKTDILIKNKFSYVSFGIQSFDKNILNYNERSIPDYSKVKELIEKLESSGIRVNCDLMAFIGEKNNQIDEIKRVRDDFINLLDNYKPSLITIYPETSFLIENKEEGTHLSLELKKMIVEIMEKYNLNSQNSHLDLEDLDYEKNLFSHLMGTISLDEIEGIRKYISNALPYQVKNQNVLSFGAYKNKISYSYHGHDFLYYVMNNKNKRPHYFIHTDNKPND